VPADWKAAKTVDFYAGDDIPMESMTFKPYETKVLKVE
jgi:hypothetical protein